MEVTDNNNLPVSCIIAINDALNEQSHQLHTSNQLSGNYSLMFRPLLHWLDKYITGIITSCNELVRINEWMDGQSNGWINEWMDGWTNGWINEWMDGQSNI